MRSCIHLVRCLFAGVQHPRGSRRRLFSFLVLPLFSSARCDPLLFGNLGVWLLTRFLMFLAEFETSLREVGHGASPFHVLHVHN